MALGLKSFNNYQKLAIIDLILSFYQNYLFEVKAIKYHYPKLSKIC